MAEEMVVVDKLVSGNTAQNPHAICGLYLIVRMEITDHP